MILLLLLPLGLDWGVGSDVAYLNKSIMFIYDICLKFT